MERVLLSVPLFCMKIKQLYIKHSCNLAHWIFYILKKLNFFGVNICVNTGLTFWKPITDYTDESDVNAIDHKG